MGRTTTTPKTRTPLTRERIVEAAMHVMDTEGLEAVSMRRVAREVGVEAMSLYNHVEDKDDLLQAVCDRVMAGFEFPEETDDWVETCKAGARSWRRVLQAHPDMMRLFAETHGPSPSTLESLKPTEFALRVLRNGGLSDRDTVQAFHVFGGFIQGFVMMESGSIQKSQGERGAFDMPESEVPDDVFPVLRAVHRYFADCSADDQFEFGLDLLVRGLRDRVADET
jgi:AcrR family transcriptional regulator